MGQNEVIVKKVKRHLLSESSLSDGVGDLSQLVLQHGGLFDGLFGLGSGQGDHPADALKTV